MTVDKYYRHVRIFPLENEPVLSAMAQAHLDTLVLGSHAIFVGRPVDAPAEKANGVANTERTSPPMRRQKRTAVKVDRLLSGPGPTKGETITVNDEDFPLPAGDAYIYFTRRSVFDEEQENRRHYTLDCRWPASEAARVEEALKHRSLYPIHETVDEYGRQRRSQEITFQGTRAETIAMLGSAFDAAQTLAARRLITEGETAIGDVAAAVEANLFRTKLGDSKSFQHQENLIRLLGILEAHRSDGQVVRLIGSMLDKVQAGANFPAEEAPSDEESLRARSYDRLGNVRNHSLAWLLRTLEERDAARVFGERILKLRDLSAYGWKDEIQYVVDHSHIEDHLALAALAPRMEKLTPKRWQAGLNAGDLSYYAVAFSADDRYCAAVGTGAGKVWNTADWSIAGEFAQSGSIVGVAFSPDNRFLYAVGGGSTEVFEKWDWQAGKVVQRYPGHDSAVTAVALSPDGKQILSSAAGYRKGSTIVRDAESAKILNRNDNDAWDRLLWHPGGTWFLGENRDAGWVRVDLDKKEKTPVELPWIDAKFSKDGQIVYCLEGSPNRPDDSDEDDTSRTLQSPLKRREPVSNPVLRRRTSTGLTVEAERKLDFPADFLTVSADGSQLVAVGSNEVEVVALPGLQSQIRSKLAITNAGDNQRRRPSAISHDLRWLFFTRDYGLPELYEVRTGRRLPFGAAHSSEIVRAAFVNEDSRLRTEGEDGVICVWDVNTKKLVERIGDPVTQKGTRRERQLVYLSEDRSVQYLFKIGSSRGRYGPPTSYSVQVAPAKSGIPADENDEDLDDTDSPDDKVAPAKTEWRKLGKADLQWGQYGPVGLVPDGRHFFIGAHVFRRDDLALLSAVNVGGAIEQVYFSPDGSRYALVTGDRVEQPTVLPGVTQHELVFHRVRVHETKTGRTLLSVEVPAPGVARVALSREGGLAAVVGRDSSIQIWPVP